MFTVTAIVLGSPLTTWVFRRVDRDARTSPQVTKAASTLRGGRAIGWLERAAVLLTVIAGWPEGVALVVALKGLGRYGELRGATEGTARTIPHRKLHEPPVRRSARRRSPSRDRGHLSGSG